LAAGNVRYGLQAGEHNMCPYFEIAGNINCWEDFAQNQNNGLFLHKTPHFDIISCTEHGIDD
jgi:hypothetical protein